MEGYEFHHQLAFRYNLKEYGLADKMKVFKLVERGEIEAKKDERGFTHISIKSFQNYLQKLDTIRNEYMPIIEFAPIITGNPKLNWIDLPTLKQFVEKSCLELLTVDPPFKRSTHFIKKSSYEQFLNDYISIEEAFKQLRPNLTIKSFRRNLIKRGLNNIAITIQYKCQFVLKEDFNNYVKKYYNNISVSEANEELGISKQNFRRVIELFKVEIFKGVNREKFMSRTDFEFLKNFQLESYNKLLTSTYTYEETQQLSSKFDVKNPLVPRKFEEPVDIHPIMQFGKYIKKVKLYNKIKIDKYIEQLEKDQEISRLWNNTYENYPQLLQQLLEIDNVYFSKEASLTQDLWFQFVNWKLKKMNVSNKTLLTKIGTYRYSTKILTKFTRQKELHEFSEAELNLSLFNNNVPKSYQQLIYAFLIHISQMVELKSGKKLFDLSKINFTYSKNVKTKVNNEKEIYSIDEYLTLYNYVKDYERHKKFAIDDVKTALNNKKDYKKYDSTWLYVLLHMNNGWRNGTVVEFKRFNFPLFDSLNLNSIESLEKLQLTYNEAEQIIKYYQMQWFEHNKTKAKAEFYCSSELTMAMAYAILICEFRCRMMHLHDEENLINFYNKHNKITPGSHNAFFKSFHEEFKFESRKMNRTVLTYTSSIIESTLKGDPIKIAQHLRGHTTMETTNSYIVLSQEHLDFITKQLFDTGYFGYVYNQLNKLLIGEPPKNKIEQTNTSMELRELLGDVAKLEDTTTFLMYLSQQREDLGKYLGEISKEELKSRLSLINLGLSPARDETYQCLFANCIATNIECNKCPFSIPHFYSLSVISKRLIRILRSYQSIIGNKEIPIGEKTKLYNLMVIDYTNLLEAKQKFGAEIIEMFIDNELNELIEVLHALPEPALID
ncbi:hypothetical protein IFR10_05960 [Bacillus sp. CFBP 13597]|nr:hypothetical protein [Bacillus sp. CFBP 13597]